jgi:hypothetical protein
VPPAFSLENYTLEPPMGHVLFSGASSERGSDEEYVPSLTGAYDVGDVGKDDNAYHSSVFMSTEGGLFADVVLPGRRAISEGGSPLCNVVAGPLVLLTLR